MNEGDHDSRTRTILGLAIGEIRRNETRCAKCGNPEIDRPIDTETNRRSSGKQLLQPRNRSRIVLVLELGSVFRRANEIRLGFIEVPHSRSRALTTGTHLAIDNDSDDNDEDDWGRPYILLRRMA
jgi:hypothetical protein